MSSSPAITGRFLAARLARCGRYFTLYFCPSWLHDSTLSDRWLPLRGSGNHRWPGASSYDGYAAQLDAGVGCHADKFSHGSGAGYAHLTRDDAAGLGHQHQAAQMGLSSLPNHMTRCRFVSTVDNLADFFTKPCACQCVLPHMRDRIMNVLGPGPRGGVERRARGVSPDSVMSQRV